ncbi:MAG: Na+/H+ antiporter subunit E [Desulfurivibrionaceae bacterium]|nr:Na+/H+ antiporter subunit E [Desulfurivibrionaceae bacterium]
MNFRSRPNPSFPLAAVAWRLGLFSGLWFLLSGGAIQSWPFGLAASLLATWLLMRLPLEQPRRVRLLAIVWFIPYFVGRSLLSGVDVMRRVLHPALPIDPALVDYPLVIDHQGGRVLLANCVSLLPGTISARLGPDILLVHSLDKELPVVETIQDLERRIERLYHPAAKAKRPEGQP